MAGSNFVTYNIAQARSDSEKLQARQNIGAAALASLAAPFESRAPSYNWSAGEVCTYGGALWQFDANHSGAWTGADAHEVTILEVLANLVAPRSVQDGLVKVSSEITEKGSVIRSEAVDCFFVVNSTAGFRVCNDNLIRYPYLQSSSTTNHVEFTVQSDGSVKINGTASAHALFYLQAQADGFVLPAGVYCFPATGLSGVAYQVLKEGTNTTISTTNYGDGQYFELSETTKVWVRIRVASGTAVSNLVVYPSICRGKHCAAYIKPLSSAYSSGSVAVKCDGPVNFISNDDSDITITYKAQRAALEKNLYVKKKDDVIQVFQRIKKSLDLCIEFRKQGGLEDGEPTGGNQLFDFCRWYYVRKRPNILSTNLDNAVQININGTDYFGPYKVFATSNINGDMPDSDDFTGGNHQYNNAGTGSSATARTLSVSLDVDGISDVGKFFNGFADRIKMRWVNRVQATNTKKEDGSGREVLREDYEMVFDGVKFVVKNNITALETIKITTYYGLQGQQFPTTSGTFNVFYEGSKTTRAAVKANIQSECGDKYCRVIRQNGNAYASLDNLGGIKMPSYDVEMTDFDLGDFSNVVDVSSSAHLSSGKVYFNLVRNSDGLALATGDVVRFIGGYRFYDSGLD